MKTINNIIFIIILIISVYFIASAQSDFSNKNIKDNKENILQQDIQKNINLEYELNNLKTKLNLLQEEKEKIIDINNDLMREKEERKRQEKEENLSLEQILNQEKTKLNFDFITSVQKIIIKKEPLYIGLKEHFDIKKTYVDNNTYEYIEYNTKRRYKMNVKQIEYNYYNTETQTWDYSYGNILGELWCSFDLECYRTGIFEGKYGDTMLDKNVTGKDIYRCLN